MAAIKYNVEDVESGGGAEQPQPALYKGKIASATHRTKNARGEACNDIEVVVDVGEEFARLWTYIQLDNPATRWKLREFTDAMGLPPKGSIDPTKLKGKPVTVKVSADTDLDGNYRGKVKNLFLPGEAPGETDDNGSEGDHEETMLTEDELNEFSAEELKEELQERGIKLAGRFSTAKAVALILEDQGEAEAEEEEETEDDDESTSTIEVDPELLPDLSTDEADYEEWSDDEVKQFMDDLGISGNLSGRKTRAKMVAHIVEFAEQVEGGGGEGGASAPEDDYDEWPDKELLDEVNTRIEQGAELKITGRKTKEKMIAALRADDSSGEPF